MNPSPDFSTLTGSCPICGAGVCVYSEYGSGEYTVEQYIDPTILLMIHGRSTRCNQCDHILVFKTDFLGSLYLEPGE